MFDIGFSEMLVIAVVALLVLGPERLPRVARTVGHLLGRAQRYVNDVKADINREMELSELKKVREEFESTARGIEQSVQASASEIESDFRQGTEGSQAAAQTQAAEDAVVPPQTIHPPAAPVSTPGAVSAPAAAPRPATAESAADMLTRLRAGDASTITSDRG